MRHDFDFYETPDPLTAWLFREHHIVGNCYEPCVGDGAIVRASEYERFADDRWWRTNDLDRRWKADSHFDAASISAWMDRPDWTVTNTPFSHWHEIAEQALKWSHVGVALYLRLSAHEPAKDKWRGWWERHPPSAIYVCPRFAHQRSRILGGWSTDSVTCAWTIWDRRMTGQVIKHAPEDVIEALTAYTPSYRARMDAIMRERE